MLEMLNRVDTPALLLDHDLLRANIKTMAAFFEPLHARLRPHFKTHKCTRIARMQIEAGAVGMTCAKVSEAEVLVSAGLRDVLIANQIVGSIKIERLMSLVARHIDLKVAVDDEENLRELSRATTARGIELGVLIEVDVGMGRCGVPVGEKLVELCQFVDASPHLVFRGLMGYEGHAVLEPESQKRKTLAEASIEELRRAKELVEEAGLEVEIVSAGGTGTYDVTGQCPDVTEIQAGSYAVMDATYRQIRSEFRPALTVLSTVVSCPRPGVAVADAGLKSVTAEFGMPLVVSHEGVTVDKLAEEHAILQTSPDVKLAVGERIALLPTHCCTTINLHEEFVLVERTRERGRWRIEARGKAQ